MRPLPYRVVRQKLLTAGFAEHTQKGSHVKFVKSTPKGNLTAIVPKHTREIPGGTLRSILKQAGITPKEFESL